MDFGTREPDGLYERTKEKGEGLETNWAYILLL